MIESVKQLLGEERLKRLAEMPRVKEKHGLEAHLEAACKGAASAAQAVINALRSAGSVPTADDVAALNQPTPEDIGAVGLPTDEALAEATTKKKKK